MLLCQKLFYRIRKSFAVVKIFHFQNFKAADFIQFPIALKKTPDEQKCSKSGEFIRGPNKRGHIVNFWPPLIVRM